MNKNFLIQLTNELYRLTLLFPKKEPLRYKMRELADDILAKCLILKNRANSVENCSRPFAELEVLDSFFEVAKNQNWVSPAEILKLQQDYSKVRGELKIYCESRPHSEEAEAVEVKPQQPQQPQQPDYETRTRNVERQQKIMETLKEKGRAQVWELKKIFPSITKRTLRRDFRFLLKQGLIERFGERNETFYKIKTKEIGQTVENCSRPLN